MSIIIEFKNIFWFFYGVISKDGLKLAIFEINNKSNLEAGYTSFLGGWRNFFTSPYYL